MTSHDLPPFPPDPAAPPPTGGLIPAEERNWAMGCHLISLCGFIGVPLGNVVGPLVIWLVKKDQMGFVDDQGKESLNFQITVTIVLMVLGILSLVPLVFCVTIPLLAVVAAGSIVLVIIAAVKANTGEPYRYPMTLRLVT